MPLPDEPPNRTVAKSSTPLRTSVRMAFSATSSSTSCCETIKRSQDPREECGPDAVHGSPLGLQKPVPPHRQTCAAG